MFEHELKVASLMSELSDRAAENRELRREIGRALRMIERGDVESAKTLLRRLSHDTSA